MHPDRKEVMTLSQEIHDLAITQPQRLAFQLHDLATKAKLLEQENATLKQHLDELAPIAEPTA